MTLELRRITGQDVFDSYITESVQRALALVNRLATRRAQGRAVDVSTSPAAAREALLDINEALGLARQTGLDEAGVAAVGEVARQIRSALEATIAGDHESAAHVLNTLMTRHHAVPLLRSRPSEAPVLRFHSEGAGPVDAWAGCAAAGVAVAIGLGHADRFGVCEAADCDQVFFDSTRNASRRFCGLPCQNRAKAAAYRARGGSAKSEKEGG
ncbi:MAG: CGNR zinc finger domain-containing protein [Catenulispora sp.]|nr:CGNR zinc finger domain-containing protein [Catenulispora sp.]